MEMCGQCHVPTALSSGKRPGTHPLQGAGWLSRAVWMAAENLAQPGIRSPDRQAGSESHTPTELSQPKGHVQNHYQHT